MRSCKVGASKSYAAWVLICGTRTFKLDFVAVLFSTASLFGVGFSVRLPRMIAFSQFPGPLSQDFCTSEFPEVQLLPSFRNNPYKRLSSFL